MLGGLMGGKAGKIAAGKNPVLSCTGLSLQRELTDTIM
jgi:hypothetical protein